MKLAAPFLAALATAENCGDLATDANFATITNAVVKDGCTNASGDECLVKCSSGNIPRYENGILSA